MLVFTNIEIINVMRQFTTQVKIFVFILLSLWLSPNKILAQLTLEATYPTTDLRRIHLPVSGEKWFYADDSTHKIYLFNANHTPWKTVNYPSEPNKTVSLDAMNMPVSETTFNSDTLLEFVWRFKDSEGRQFVKIMNERGALVYDFGQGINVLTVNELLDNPTKLFVESGNYDRQKTAIFSLPNMRLDTIFDYAGDMQRRKFTYAGEKFYFKNRNTNFLEILNTDYTRWKAFKIHKTRNGLKIEDDIFFADDGLFTSDSSVGCMLTYRYSDEGPLKKIVSEISLNTKLMYANSYSQLWLDQKRGQLDKLFLINQTNINSTPKYEIFSLSRIKKEKTHYKSNVERLLFKAFGAKFRTYTGNNEVQLYDTLHNEWKLIKLEPTFNFGINYHNPPLVCDSIVNQDTLLEAIWIERKDRASNLRITTENETNLATIPNASYFHVSKLDNLPNKLVTKMSNGFKDFETKVWRFSTRTPVSDPSVQTAFDATISPNPFSNSFSINVLAHERPLSIRLFNAIGVLVFAEKMTTSNATFTPPNGLPQGVYWCQISDGKSQIVKKLVKMN